MSLNASERISTQPYAKLTIDVFTLERKLEAEALPALEQKSEEASRRCEEIETEIRAIRPDTAAGLAIKIPLGLYWLEKAGEWQALCRPRLEGSGSFF